MSKSKVITLPAGTTVTLWREESQMCVGLNAPHLSKGVRLSTKASGEAGKELAAYLQTLRLAPIVEEMEEAGLYVYDYDENGGSIRWGTDGQANSGVIDFAFDGINVLDISGLGAYENPYLLATFLRRIIDTYDRKIPQFVHRDVLPGALLALSYQPKVVINPETQLVEKGDDNFKLVQAGSNLGFLIGDGASFSSIRFATGCAKALNRPDALIVLSDNSLEEVPEDIDPEPFIRAHMNQGNCVWASPKGEDLVIYAPDGVVYTVSRDLVILRVMIEGKPFDDFGADWDLIWHVGAVIFGSEAPVEQVEVTPHDQLAHWIEKMRIAGVADPEGAARMLIAQGMA